MPCVSVSFRYKRNLSFLGQPLMIKDISTGHFIVILFFLIYTQFFVCLFFSSFKCWTYKFFIYFYLFLKKIRKVVLYLIYMNSTLIQVAREFTKQILMKKRHDNKYVVFMYCTRFNGIENLCI